MDFQGRCDLVFRGPVPLEGWKTWCQRYGNLVDLPFAIVNCLGWHPTMTHVLKYVKVAVPKHYFVDALMNWIYNKHMRISSIEAFMFTCCWICQYIFYGSLYLPSKRPANMRVCYKGHRFRPCFIFQASNILCPSHTVRIAEMYVDAVLVKFLLKKLVLNFLELRFYPPNKQSKTMIFSMPRLGINIMRLAFFIKNSRVQHVKPMGFQKNVFGNKKLLVCEVYPQSLRKAQGL